MSLNMGDQEYNSGKKYRQKGTLCGPNKGYKPNSNVSLRLNIVECVRGSYNQSIMGYVGEFVSV
jgi:hypothetical protein